MNENKKDLSSITKKHANLLSSNDVVVKKPGKLQKIKNAMVSDDAKNIKSYVFLDVLIPAAKKAISDMVTNGIDMLLYGDTRGRKRDDRSGGVSYRSYYEKKDRFRDSYERANDREPARFGRGKYEDIGFKTRARGEEMVDLLNEVIDQFDVVTISDYCEILMEHDRDLKIEIAFTDYKYGWKDLRDVPVVYRHGLWYIDFPTPKPID